MVLDVKYPILFLLILPVGFMLYLFYRKSHIQNKWEKNWITILRAIIFLLIIFALTVPQMLLPVKGENVIFLVDRSASMQGTEDKAVAWIGGSIQSKHKDDSYSIITIGKNAAMEQPLNRKETPIQQLSADIDEGETNLEEGIQLAASLIPENQKGRIVLFSDGNETAGNALEAARQLTGQHTVISYVPMQGKHGEDIALTEFNVPTSMYKGEKAELKVKMVSDTQKEATIRISLNNHEILKKKVTVKEGENLFTFSHIVKETGMYVYKAEVTTSDDTYLENNELYAVSNVSGTPKVLIVQDENDSALAKLLQSANVQVETTIPEKMPTVMTGYLPYQSIIFNNVPATTIGEQKMELIEKAVKDFGTGFIMTGGENSFGLGGYFKTPIEKILPVDMDIKGKKKLPSLGLVIVLDRSGSMGGQKLALAKEAAARSVELLRDEDTIGFIAFDDRPWEIVKTAPIKNKKNVMNKIRSVEAGGGTEIYTSLQLAYERLKPLKLQRKHIILLTDGQSSTNSSYQTLVEEGKKDNITISTVALGQDADRNLLEDISKYGAGRFYYVTDSTVIPSILSRETVMATRTYIEDNPFYPKVQPYPEWVKLFENGVPKMNAYIAVTPKSTAQVSILSKKDDPILAQWQYGLGQTAAFTSDTSGKWAGDFARWEGWSNFWSQLVTKTFPSYENVPYEINLKKENGDAKITLKSDKLDLLPLEAAVVSQEGKEMKVQTKMTAPGEYELNMEDKAGMYFLRLKQQTEDGSTKLYQTGFTVPYSDEYLQKGINKPFLKEISSITKGKKLTKESEAFAPIHKASFKKQPFGDRLLLIAFLLFFLEIAIRRFGLQKFLSLFPKKKERPHKEKEASTHVNQLIRTKDRSTRPMMEKQKEISVSPPQIKDRNNTKETQDSPSNEERLQRLMDAKKRRNR
ncbi:VWA domain-containing protein [Margalitia sp. FSL K6-0131]|uniref:VWA domain-containing protein n=1 Tax=Margalitia sp. FSL K6-0131 TaxID=2954604 RepID=UPI0030F8F716